jgi:hypothetical protein
MPTGFWKPKSVVVGVPELGEVRIGNGTIGTLKSAASASEGLTDESQAIVFANELLSNMSVDPKMSSEEVGNLLDNQVRPLAEAAIRLFHADASEERNDHGDNARVSQFKAIED